MNTIYKYKIKKDIPINIPRFAIVLKARFLNEKSFDVEIWCDVDTNDDNGTLLFTLIENGTEIDKRNVLYIDTLFKGDKAWHLLRVMNNG